MDGTSFFDDIEAGDGDDFPTSKEFTQDATTLGIAAFLIERGHENSVVQNEEVHITCGQDRQSPTRLH